MIDYCYGLNEFFTGVVGQIYATSKKEGEKYFLLIKENFEFYI